MAFYYTSTFPAVYFFHSVILGFMLIRGLNSIDMNYLAHIKTMFLFYTVRFPDEKAHCAKSPTKDKMV